MLKQRLFRAILVSLAATTFNSGQARETQGSTRPPDRGEDVPDVLIAGGDTVLARWEHDLVTRHEYDWPLRELRDVLSSADAALCNLECCISLNGRPASKGERCPFYYRARPEMLMCLTLAGVDIVTAANNHGGDYGPESVADTCLWTERAGLVCAGIGTDLSQAETPRLVRVGRTRVGVCGLDTTQRHFRATADSAGTNYVSEDDGLEEFTAKMRKLREWADGRCDLLLLTIHWGANWTTEPPAHHREMARIAVSHGVDAILGHSAHRLQGIELVDGKPVLYDMGNLLFDCRLRTEGVRSALFRLYLTPAGIQRVEVLPILVLEGHSVPATGEEAVEILTGMDVLCAPLGTRLSREKDDRGRLLGVIDLGAPSGTRRGAGDARPVGGTSPSTLPGDPLPARGRLAGEIPEDARKILPPVTVAPGLELTALQLPETVAEGGILYIRTWWRVKAEVSRSTLLAFQLRVSGLTARRGTPWYTRHDAADWSVPLSRMEPGEVVEDLYPARLQGIPCGSCDVSAVVLDSSRPPGERLLGIPCSLGTIQIKPRTRE